MTEGGIRRLPKLERKQSEEQKPADQWSARNKMKERQKHGGGDFHGQRPGYRIEGTLEEERVPRQSFPGERKIEKAFIPGGSRRIRTFPKVEAEEEDITNQETDE